MNGGRRIAHPRIHWRQVHGALLRNGGCFNYFTRGTRAPNLTDDFPGLLIPTCWRLLWEDRRYVNGVVPDESQYFLEPRQAPQTSMNP
ncbi:Imm72 family immunity protein [Burkholderia cepacia]|uniref:Imm72 family immunity protein n=1 Tax=Burkholderia cepacia TaxID=292 RepID=UPI002E781AD2|nr:Imm72 family immunity protein [Burkholderia cepacia]